MPKIDLKGVEAHKHIKALAACTNLPRAMMGLKDKSK